MTREEILAMKQGRELDALVAEHVFGLRVERVKPDWYDREVTLFISPESGLVVYSYDTRGCNAMIYRNRKDPSDGVAQPLPFFSEEIEAAWQVVERMYTLGFGMKMLNKCSHGPDRPFENAVSFARGEQLGFAYGPDAAETICKAALLAVMGSGA